MTSIKADTPRELYNILLLGDPRSGKTHFFNELSETSLSLSTNEYLITTNINFSNFNYNIRGRNLCIHLWDTPGSTAYHQIIARFMIKSFNIIIIMFNVDTFFNIPYWIEFINKQQFSYTPIIVLMDNGISLSKDSHQQSPDIIIAKYPYLRYSIHLHGQSSYILKNIIEESIINKPTITPLCCKDRKNNRCCF